VLVVQAEAERECGRGCGRGRGRGSRSLEPRQIAQIAGKARKSVAKITLTHNCIMWLGCTNRCGG
jgi:hypothetical protein